MQLSRAELYRIVIEEYLKEEGASLNESKAQELIDYIKGGPKPDWYDDQGYTVPDPPVVPEPKALSGRTPGTAPPGETTPLPRARLSDADVLRHLPKVEWTPAARSEAILSILSGLGDRDDKREALTMVYLTLFPEDAEEEEELEPSPYSGKAVDQRRAQQGMRTGFEESIDLNDVISLINEALDDYHDWEWESVLDPEEEQSKEAIAGAALQREDGLSFEEWIQLLLSTLHHTTSLDIEHEEALPPNIDYYDKWVSGEDAMAVSAEIAIDKVGPEPDEIDV